MDKKIVDKLIKFGLITNIGVDANKYTDIDDLIAKGIITIPGAKIKIMELLGDDNIVVEEITTEDKTVNTVVDTPVEEEVTAPEVEVIVEEKVTAPEVEVIVEEKVTAPEVEVIVEEVVEDTEVEETPTKSEKKSGKSTKN